MTNRIEASSTKNVLTAATIWPSALGGFSKNTKSDNDMLAPSPLNGTATVIIPSIAFRTSSSFANSTAVNPLFSRICKSTLLSRKSTFTASVRPYLLATIMGVKPLSLTALTSTSSARSLANNVVSEATCSRVFPFPSTCCSTCRGC